MRLALKLFRGEPAISEFDWNFSPIHTSSPPFSTDVCSVLHYLLRQLQPGHGQITRFRVYDKRFNRAFNTRFRFASGTQYLKLASYYNSPDRSTKSTTSHLNVLCLLVNIGFQVLFHSPPGVLFNFPSRYFFTIGYQLVFSLTGWSPLLHTRFHVSRTTLDSTLSTCFSYTGLSPSLVCFPKQFY